MLVNAFPTLRSRFVNYGSRTTEAEATDRTVIDQKRKDGNSHGFLRVLNALSGIQVPHSYFQHFYIVSVFSSLFWLCQIIAQSSPLRAMCGMSRNTDLSRSMSIDQVFLTWSLMFIQGVRRLVESTILAKPSASKMWLVHWLLGITFYLAVGASVWIEGSGKIC